MNICPLCTEIGGRLIHQNDFVRIINANDPHYPAFTRVVLQRHLAEMTDLSIFERQRLMEYVYLIEQVQRDILQPDKINLAAFGTMVPHLHWHIIPRFKWDLHYPASVWSPPTRTADNTDYQTLLQQQQQLLDNYEKTLLITLKTFNG